MPRPFPSVLALTALAGSALLVPVPASAQIPSRSATVSVADARVRFDASGRSGVADLSYTCAVPTGWAERTELQTALHQPPSISGPVVAFPEKDYVLTCDGTARTLRVTYSRASTSEKNPAVVNGKALLSLYLGSGGPSDTDVPDAEVTVTGVGTPGTRVRAFDFDGDGHDDLAVGAPGELVGTRDFAGAVSVLRGTATGPTAEGNQVWSQDSTGISGTAEFGDRFGATVASADFDGDGHADLATGVPSEALGTTGEAGMVNVLYGTSSGLGSARDQGWSQDSKGVPGAARSGERFGSALAAADFNGDGFADLAVGVPNEKAGGAAYAGAVSVLYGSKTGLRSTGAQLWSQATSGVRGSSEYLDAFGSSLAAADVDGDGRADLAIGVPGENAGAGAVALLRGGSKGLTASGDQLWSQDSAGLEGTADTGDGFGSALAFGDVNADGHADLAVGVPSDVVVVCDECDSQGAVQVLPGTTKGLTAAGSQLWHVGQPGLPGDPAAANDFGAALVSGDFDGDGAGDLAVAAPGADVADQPGAGTVYVLDGSGDGLRAGSVITQATPGVPGDPEPVGGFQMTLGARRFAAAQDSLVIGLPGITVGGHDSAGGVLVVPGTDEGLEAAGTRLWTQASPGVAENPEDLDQFGHVSG